LTANVPQADNSRYDPGTNTWSARAVMPAAAGQVSVASQADAIRSLLR